MQFKIIGKRHIKDLKHSVPTVVISISCNHDPDLIYNPDPLLLDVLHLKFNDVENSNLAVYKEAFTDKQAIQVINFIEKYKDKVDLIICQCCFGISRSAGTASALSFILNGPRSENWIFERYTPNMHVYRTLLNQYSNMDK